MGKHAPWPGKQIVTVQRIKWCTDCPYFNHKEWGPFDKRKTAFYCKKRGNKTLDGFYTNLSEGGKREILAEFYYPEWCPLDEYNGGLI